MNAMQFELLSKDPYRRAKLTQVKGGQRMKTTKTTNIDDMSTLAIVLHLLNRHKLFMVVTYASILTFMYLLQGLPIAIHHVFR